MTLTVWDQPRSVIEARTEAVVRLPALGELVECWPAIGAHLRKATVITGCYEPIDLLAMAMRGQVGIWVCEVDGAIAAALVTEIKQYPRRRVLEVMFGGGGNMRDWLPAAIDALDEHARQAGCEHIATIGRPGWARAWGGELTGNVLIVRGLKDQR